MTLVCYDIGADSLRTRIGRALLEAGLERINRSVYLGQLKDHELRHLEIWLRKAMEKAASTDSLIILPVPPGAAWQMEVLGQNDLDLPAITGTQHTLII
jgi:CRISPR-associated endonuclease Cas2